ncbi:MAG: hypothetical protein LDL53_02395 [Candidatus Hydrogenedens sp.]|nr:hypothetical protein [Candidatus Hydrogenedens sp.]
MTIINIISGVVTFYGEIPEDVPTFLIKTSKEQTQFYGAIIIQNQWLKESTLPELTGKSVEIVIDTPWDTPQIHRREMGHRIEISYEAPVLRRKRLEEGWRKNGYTLIDTKNGKKVIKNSLYQQALQAIEMAHNIYNTTLPPHLLQEPTHSEIETEVQNTTLLKIWGLHIFIITIGIICLSLIIWKYFLTESEI